VVTRARAVSPAAEAWSLLMELMWTHKGDFVASMAEEGLSPMQAHALRLLEKPRAMSELAEVLWCDASNVTGIIDRLEARGLVERHPSPQDRRVKRLSLTEEGERVRRRVVARMHRPPAELASLSLEDQRALRKLLARALGR
jgi:DNA-binding MarR family transcriptional regulator